MSVLDRIVKTRVDFDPANTDHIAAANLVINGCQDTDIRFVLDPRFNNIRDMLLSKLANAYIEERLAA